MIGLFTDPKVFRLSCNIIFFVFDYFFLLFPFNFSSQFVSWFLFPTLSNRSVSHSNSLVLAR